MFVNLVWSRQVDERWCKAIMRASPSDTSVQSTGHSLAVATDALDTPFISSAGLG
jgi:hypothetical protein